ncbi:TPA: helix-turn-helix domain-containing protein [Escherichia coli]|nr:helix-turn-helix domain-containing protein [Escherichia coli]
MKLKTTLFGNVYQFKDVKEVLAKANELRSGDVLAGVAATSSQERVAESISHQSYRRLLSRAREYVLENMSEPVTVLDLCNQLHVSRRTLQNAFHAILGIGPNAWLKRIRLNAVRRELISPWSQSTTVKDAAMQWGFWHLGQFATDYQQLFAEKPSLTLHQRMREWGEGVTPNP